MKNTTHKILLVLYLFINTMAFANDEIPPAPGTASRGVGGGGTGAPAAPIDMYMFALSIIAVLFIVFFATRYKNQKI